MTTGNSILQDAIEIQKRNDPNRPHKDGGSVDPFYKIAALWNAYMGFDPRGDGPWIGAADVAMMMALFKAAREAFAHNRDNLVDMAGYAHCAEVLFELAAKSEPKPGDAVTYVGEKQALKNFRGTLLEVMGAGELMPMRVKGEDGSIYYLKKGDVEKVDGY